MRILKILIFALALTVWLTAAALAQDVYIDGEKVIYDETTGDPFIENGAILVPLYPTFEAFGCDGIIQDNPTGTVVITKGGISVCCSTNNNIFTRNGTKTEAPAGLVWRGGPLYVAVDIFKAFDAQVYINGSGVIITRSPENDGQAGVFGATSDESYRGSEYFGAKREPPNGLYLGCNSHGDPLSGMEAFNENYGKKAAAFTVYADITKPFSDYDRELRYSIQNEKLVRFVINGIDFLSPDTERISQAAEYLENSGAKILLNPAPSMTCVHSENYFPDYETYRQSFNIISEIFKRKAPSVALIWQVCTCNRENCELYYPGNMYIDYVETVLCGNDTESREKLPLFVSAYGYKKPIILEADISPEVFGQHIDDCLEFCTYLPINHPQIKAVFFPDLAKEDNKTPAYLNAIRTGVSSISYIESSNDTPASMPYYFEFGSGIDVPAAKMKICSRYSSEKAEASYVIYKLNGKQISTPAKSIPFEAQIDFSQYAGKTVSLEVTIYDSFNRPCIEKTYALNVGTQRISESENSPAGLSPYGYISAILICLTGIFVIIKKINDIFC